MNKETFEEHIKHCGCCDSINSQETKSSVYCCGNNNSNDSSQDILLHKVGEINEDIAKAYRHGFEMGCDKTKNEIIIQIYKFINQDKFKDVSYMNCPEKLNVPVFLERIKEYFDVDYEGVVN